MLQGCPVNHRLGACSKACLASLLARGLGQAAWPTFGLLKLADLLAKPLGQPLGQAKPLGKPFGQASWPSLLAGLLAKPLGQPFGEASWPSLLAKSFGQASWPASWPSLLASPLAKPLDRPLGQPLGQASWPASWPSLLPAGAQLPPSAKPKPKLPFASVTYFAIARLFASLAHSHPQTQNLGQYVAYMKNMMVPSSAS